LVRIEDGVASDTFHELLRTESPLEGNSNKRFLNGGTVVMGKALEIFVGAGDHGKNCFISVA
jgi:hypothetical protein